MGTNYYLVNAGDPIEKGIHIGKVSNGGTWLFQAYLQPRKFGDTVLGDLSHSSEWFWILKEFSAVFVKDEKDHTIDRVEFVKMLESLKPASIPHYLPSCLKSRYYTDAWGYTFMKGDWD